MKLGYRLTVLSSLVISVWSSLSTAVQAQSPIVVSTTSGSLQGEERNGVISFKGIPFALPPVGALRWQVPKPFIPGETTLNVTELKPACVQQFIFASHRFIERLFNTPAPHESEDCLYLNVWAPALGSGPKPVVIWFFGGSFAFGTASLEAYDGTSFAQNQGIVIVTTNYRTNVFGFPGAEELPPHARNLGFMDQDLSLQWVQHNIAAFGGDPSQVTIMGQSAGSQSVAQMIQRFARNTPFRAAIMQSGAATSISPIPNFSAFDTLAKDLACIQSPGGARMACMQSMSADTIKLWLNGPQGLPFEPTVDNMTVWPNPIQRLQEGLTAVVPILIGANQDDGTLFTVGETNLPALLTTMFGPIVSAQQVRALYPGLNDTQIIPRVVRDVGFLCPAELTASAFFQLGIVNVYRYIYGPVFANLLPSSLPTAGAFHASEIPEIFGTFNASTSTTAEKTLSHTMQTIWANFIKDPFTLPIPAWPPFDPANDTNTLAKLAYNGNVLLSNIIQTAPSGLDDSPCDALWNGFLMN